MTERKHSRVQDDRRLAGSQYIKAASVLTLYRNNQKYDANLTLLNDAATCFNVFRQLSFQHNLLLFCYFSMEMA